MNAEEIRARLAEANRLDPADGGPGGTGYVEAMRALVPHAEALGDPGLLFTVRLSFSWALRFKPLEDKGSGAFFGEAVPVLRRCLLMWHAEPHLFDADDVRAMWNQFFLNVDVYTWLYPEPADRIHRFLDELEKYCPPTRVWTRYAIEYHRMIVDARRGDVGAVERRWHRLRAQGDPDEHFHLDGKACQESRMWQRLGRNDRALEVLAPLAAGQVSARGQEFADDLIMPYLRAGRLDEAVVAHQRTYARPGMKLEDVAGHLEFCARTGNEERGIEVLHRNLNYFANDVTSVESMWTAAAGALLCRQVLAKNLDREWIWPCDCGKECDCQTEWSFADLGAVLRWDAVAFAAKVDELNGTGFQGEKIREVLASGPIVGSLPLPPARSPYVIPTPDPDTVAPKRLAFLAELVSRPRSRRYTLFTTLAELVRSQAIRDPYQRDQIWEAVPTTLDRVLVRPAVHLAQVDGLLRALEPHCRNGSGDLHTLRWFRVELEVRRGDADAATAAWTAFTDLPPAGEYTTPENILRRTLWWLDLGLDDAIASRPPKEDHLIVPYLRAGRHDEARAVHERTRETATDAPEVAAHLEYCAATGNLDLGRRLILRHLDLFRNDRNDWDCTIDRIRLYGAVTRLCDRIADDGAEEPWTWPGDECCDPEEGWTYTRLADECRVDHALFVARWAELGARCPTC